MTTDNVVCTATCSNCGAALAPDTAAKPAGDTCPICGSIARTFSVRISDTITVRDRVEVVHKDPKFKAKRRVRTHVINGKERSYSGGWVDKLRVVNRNDDYYRELITDEATGEVIRNIEKPLSKHINRGSARQKPEDD